MTNSDGSTSQHKQSQRIRKWVYQWGPPVIHHFIWCQYDTFVPSQSVCFLTCPADVGHRKTGGNLFRAARLVQPFAAEPAKKAWLCFGVLCCYWQVSAPFARSDVTSQRVFAAAAPALDKTEDSWFWKVTASLVCVFGLGCMPEWDNVKCRSRLGVSMSNSRICFGHVDRIKCWCWLLFVNWQSQVNTGQMKLWAAVARPRGQIEGQIAETNVSCPTLHTVDREREGGRAFCRLTNLVAVLCCGSRSKVFCTQWKDLESAEKTTILTYSSLLTDILHNLAIKRKQRWCFSLQDYFFFFFLCFSVRNTQQGCIFFSLCSFVLSVFIASLNEKWHSGLWSPRFSPVGFVLLSLPETKTKQGMQYFTTKAEMWNWSFEMHKEMACWKVILEPGYNYCTRSDHNYSQHKARPFQSFRRVAHGSWQFFCCRITVWKGNGEKKSDVCFPSVHFNVLTGVWPCIGRSDQFSFLCHLKISRLTKLAGELRNCLCHCKISHWIQINCLLLAAETFLHTSRVKRTLLFVLTGQMAICVHLSPWLGSRYYRMTSQRLSLITPLFNRWIHVQAATSVPPWARSKKNVTKRENSIALCRLQN